VTVTSALPRARWSVMWVKGKEIFEREFGGDLSEALRVYVMVQRAGRTGATLRCQNVGFPPPQKLEGKMGTLNRRGVGWCPYCMKLRKFEMRKGFDFEGEWIEKKAYYCPMCDISSDDNNVLRYNPLYASLGYRRRSRGRSKKRGRRKRR
jgi:hypothetical protein